jgi:hypothetical protein
VVMLAVKPVGGWAFSVLIFDRRGVDERLGNVFE